MIPRHQFYRIVVEGRGRFPIDMLRHDQCFPISERDSETIKLQGEKRTVELGSVTCRHALNVATPGRWESFGWKVVQVENV